MRQLSQKLWLRFRLKESCSSARLEALVKQSAPGAAAAVEHLAKLLVPAGLGILENLSRQGVQAGFASLESLAKQGVPGVLASLDTLAKVEGYWALGSLLRLAGDNVPGAVSVLEGLARGGKADLLSVMQTLVMYSAPGVMPGIEKLAEQRVAGVVPLLETLTRFQRPGAMEAICRLASSAVPGALSALENLAKDKWPGAIPAIEAVAGRGSVASLEALAAAHVGDALASIEVLARKEAPGAIAALESLARKGTGNALATIETLAKAGVKDSYGVLDKLAADHVVGALGAMANVVHARVDLIRPALIEVLKTASDANLAGALDAMVRARASDISRTLNLGSDAALALVRAQVYLAGTDYNRLTEVTQARAMAARSLIIADAPTIAKGIGLTVGLLGDASNTLRARATTLLVSSIPANLDQKGKAAALDVGSKALNAGLEAAKGTRIGAAVFKVVDNPKDEAAYKALIAEGVLMYYTKEAKLPVAEIETFTSFASSAAAGKVFDAVGIGDEVRQAARATANLVARLQDGFVNTYTAAVLDSAFDAAKHTAQNCYALGKAIGSGNIDSIGKAVGTLAEGLATDYINAVKTYYVEGATQAFKAMQTAFGGLLNDLGATPYAEKMYAANKQAMIELGNYAKQGGEIAVKELDRFAHMTGRVAEDAAHQLIEIAGGPVNEVSKQAKLAIEKIERLGGPAREALYEAARHFEAGANVVADVFRKGGQSAIDWARDLLGI